jgi:hypothetical protein
MKKSIRIIALALVAVMMCVTLVACAPAKDPADAKAALEDAGYVVTKLDNEGLGKLAFAAFELAGIEGAKNVVSATKDGEHITIFYFEDNAAANAEWEDVQEYATGEKDEESDWVCKKSGNMIYFGTSAAVKAAK